MILLVPVPSAVMRWRLSLTAMAIIRLATNIMLVACTAQSLRT